MTLEEIKHELSKNGASSATWLMLLDYLRELENRVKAMEEIIMGYE